MNKKTIISNTILFVVIVAFIMAFSAVFGQKNVLIGVTTVTAMLMFLERDLTIHPVSNTAKLVVLNLLIGVAAFLAGLNMWLAVPINFISMFIISYSFLYSLRTPLYLPFSLQYLFILAFPVSIDQMPLRLASLLFGALAIMGLQMLVNKNKIAKSGSKKVQAICTALIEKIEQVKKGDNTDSLNEQIAADISSLRSMIYDKREKGFYLTEEGQIKLNLSASLEKINLLLNKTATEELPPKILDDLVRCLQLASAKLDPKQPQENRQDSFFDILSKYKSGHTHSLLVLSILNNIDFLKDNLTALESVKKKSPNMMKTIEQIPLNFRKSGLKDTPSHTKSMKLSYAVRMALGISISGLIVDLFDWSEGRWMMFTVFSVVIPIYEQSRQKMRDRIFATVVGSILVVILFTIFQDATTRSILLMVGGYLMNYIKAYRYSTIIVTFSAIGAAALVTDATEILTIHRIGLVIAGIILALLINKFVLPYKQQDATNDLETMYTDVINEMMKEVIEKAKDAGTHHGIKNLLMVTSMIEERIKLHHHESKTDPNVEWLQHQRLAACTLYELYSWMEKYGVKESAVSVIVSSLQGLLGRAENDYSLKAAISKLKEQIGAASNIQDQMTLNMILEITTELEGARAAR
ncbi:FUSC family protein [Pseudobacillus badius]|uniref:FUSC family protein n=1 Tax=Bacillus badius TaxID=1455 RepID=UPI0024A36270|nr:FUSC family protein [Bacillus badius]GLY11820.1 FUSC family protein [Bacillus badius]